MSAQHTTHDPHGGHQDGDTPHHDANEPHSTFSGYMTGFVLSIILTAIPFWLVMAKVIADRNTAVLVLGGFAVIQILVHMVYFLHMNGKIEGGWTLLATIFTVVFVAITIAGTLWVMFHMNANMMPEHPPMPGMAPAGADVRNTP
ncbi:MAG: cytochrome o ubiquinol oxidase subunit IV [Gammaproteobacteria bacterium]|jgi:cytochrome o ubiquinol oxidase subunit IV|nr:cytochrome o ubiquinol oxidase subunit IV [Gammaproteobacteria bacterium]MBU0830498.1 cytochrome o ubiquinol oxidase subunit IV [Gammaproteobacteria bacterium]MBU0891272.1 cytochrome o ubiquinol oxidase subunit IV [Gammaproteobacteria bacterium]MBU1816257.1 cytochrome o ubiquinol oxidase subunit IV [Gammaproteobacteria bacterium]